jgi:GH15 family glucan-1,4-alpha-glucosidase
VKVALVTAPELDPSITASGASPYRHDGFVPLRSYAAIGDGRTVALVAEDGAIDWLPLPGLDEVPAFAAQLDPGNGGRIELAPIGDFRSERQYVPETNVLQTTFITDTGRVTVTDALNVGVAGRLPWTELARRVDGVDGTVEMAWRVAPGTCFDMASPWARETPHGRVFRARAQPRGLCLRGTRRGLHRSGRRRVVHGRRRQRRIIGVVASKGEPLMLSAAGDVDHGVDRTIDAWRTWSAQFDYTGDWQDAVRRSALALKLLIFSATGAIAAAATTSLPERVSGNKNWDYRYAWVRDTAYTVATLLRFGLREETHAAVSWLLRTVRRHGPEVGVFYRLDGSRPDAPQTYDVPGWQHIGPVVTGNDADGQLQLSIFADLFDTVRLYVDNGHALDTDTGHLLSGYADQACDAWRQRDAGQLRVVPRQRPAGRLGAAARGQRLRHRTAHVGHHRHVAPRTRLRPLALPVQRRPRG